MAKKTVPTKKSFTKSPAKPTEKKAAKSAAKAPVMAAFQTKVDRGLYQQVRAKLRDEGARVSDLANWALEQYMRPKAKIGTKAA